jgi:hypothetical protein
MQGIIQILGLVALTVLVIFGWWMMGSFVWLFVEWLRRPKNR